MTDFRIETLTNIMFAESADTSENSSPEVQYVDGMGYCLTIDENTFPAEFTIDTETGCVEDDYCYDEDGELICLRWFYDENSGLYAYADSAGWMAYTSENDPYSDITDYGYGKVTLNIYIDADISDGDTLTIYLKETEYEFITYVFTVDADETSCSFFVPAGNYQMTIVQNGFETTNEIYSRPITTQVGFFFKGDYNAYDDDIYFARYLVSEDAGDMETDSGLETESEAEPETMEETSAQSVTETSAASESVGDASYLLETQEEVVVETKEESTSLGVFCLIVTVIIYLVKRRKHYNRFF